MPSGDEQFVVTLRAEGAGPPAVVRLRRWLKFALRGYGLRCVSAVQLPTRTPSDDLASRRHPGPSRHRKRARGAKVGLQMASVTTGLLDGAAYSVLNTSRQRHPRNAASHFLRGTP
jgi:hypothetical protein